MNNGKSVGEYQDLPVDLDAFFRDASVPIMILESDRFVYANPVTIQELQYSSSDEFPMENPESISPRFQPDGELSRLKARRMLTLAKETGSARFEWMHRRTSGEDFLSEVILTPIQSGSLHYTIATWTDISKREIRRKEREELAKRAEAALKTQAIAELASGMAHDLGNFLQLAEQSSVGRSAEYCKHAHESVLQARELVQRIMNVGFETDETSAAICLNHFLDDARALLRMIVGPRRELIIEMPTDELSVLGNKGRLERAILNLVSNATDATDDGGSIQIALRRSVADDAFCDANRWAIPGDYAVIDVVDDGVGIERELQREVFEPFYSSKRRSSGTGLGLSSVASCFAEMGGGVTLLSDAGSGSTFSCYVPLIDHPA